MTSSFQPSIPQGPATASPLHFPVEFEASIAALWVFPIKSCAGISLQHAVLTSAGLAYDRAWMVVDINGEMVTQRELPRMVLIQPELVNSDSNSRVTGLVLHAPGMTALHLRLGAEVNPSVDPFNKLTSLKAHAIKVRVWDDQVFAFDMGKAASNWITEFLGNSLGPLRLVHFDQSHHRPSSVKWTQGFVSHNMFSDGFPILVASTASLDELNARLQAKGHAGVDMRRFRANVILGQGAKSLALNAHDEDRVGMFTFPSEQESVKLLPVKPCPRCPIPNIDPDSSKSSPAVSDTLQTYRQDQRVNGAVTFGMNCLPVAGIGQVLRVGQTVSAEWAF